MQIFRKISNIIIVLLLTGMLNLFIGCNEHKSNEGNNLKITALDSGIISPQLVLSDQSVVKVINEPVEGNISIPGYISFDPRRNEKVATRFNGRIEKLYFRYDYQYVKKGEKILEIYSPELNTFQDEYLYLFKSADDKILLNNARTKLQLLGMTDAQINKLEETGAHASEISIFSPKSGYLIFDEEVNMSLTASNKKSMTDNNMSEPNLSGKQQPMENSSKERIREGSYVTEGQTLFSINDLKEVWGIFSLETKYQSLMKTGMSLEVSSELNPDEVIHARVDLVEPEFKAGQKFILLRSYLKNTQGLLKINSLLSGKIFLSGAKKIQLPNSSIYDLGTRKIVWVYTGKMSGQHKIFERREVVTGMIAGELTEIIRGLNGSEELAKDAGYMIDSESLLPSDSL